MSCAQRRSSTTSSTRRDRDCLSKERSKLQCLTSIFACSKQRQTVVAAKAASKAEQTSMLHVEMRSRSCERLLEKAERDSAIAEPDQSASELLPYQCRAWVDVVTNLLIALQTCSQQPAQTTKVCEAEVETIPQASR